MLSNPKQAVSGQTNHDHDLNNLNMARQSSISIKLRLLTGLLIFIVAWFAFPTYIAHADGPDKSGVSPQVISLPSGPGSIEGIGESFEPDLSTGTASYPVKFELPPGVVGFEPDLTLSYNGGHPNGPWGLSWKLSVPYVQRQTDEGLPSYDDDANANAEADRFIYSSGEKLVSLPSGDYRFENEGQFMRFRRLIGGGWEAHLPNGTRYLFGESESARETNGYGIFRWRLERQIDIHGNEIRYFYTENGGYAYLSEVRYNFSRDGRYNAVRFTYEERPDVFTSRVSRAPITIAWRCAQIEMWALGRLVRLYRFDYMPTGKSRTAGTERHTPNPSQEGSAGTHSLLSSITQVGDDGFSELPPTTFTYSQFDPTAYEVVSMENPPPIGLLNEDADLVDINADGLPDVVYTPNNGHRFYLNRGQGRWQPTPEYPEQSPGARLSNPNIRMVDVTGNGQVDLVVKTGSRFYYYAGQAGREWEEDDRVDYNVNPFFELNEPNLRWFDANHDKRVDLMLTTDTRYYIWLAHADDSWSETADFVVPSLAVGSPLLFSDSRLKLGDMTGDRLQELVFVRDGLVMYWPSNGNGDYADPISMTNAPAGLGDLANLLQLGDLNNDGLGDLLLAGNRSVRYWLNRGDDSFADAVVLTGTPAYNQTDTTVRLADIDGDGASELLYSRYPAAVDEVMQYVDFSTGTQPHLLRTIDNGLGRTISIEYQPSTAFYVDDWDNNEPWQTTLPFPVQVVSRVTVHDALSGDDYLIEYRYRDGYYDGLQKEFRGFAQVDKTEQGDESAATTITHHVYDTGVEDESRKGLVLEMEVLGEGGECPSELTDMYSLSAVGSRRVDNGCYRREVNQPTTRILYDGDNSQVAYSFIAQTDAFIHENEETPVQLRQTFDRDEYGNPIEQFNYGQVCADDVTCGDDELLKSTEYALNLDKWIINTPSVERQTDAEAHFVTEKRFYYDGEPYVGLPSGQVERGDLTRQEENLGSQGNNRFIRTKRQAFDDYGNVIGIMDANGNLTTVEYDPLVHTFPVMERLHLDDGESLSMVASYHMGFGQITAATDFSGHPHLYAYDTFGRIRKIALPGDTLALPTQQFTYTLGAPLNWITTAERERSGGSEVRQSVTYFDGLGRQLQTRREAENGQVVVDGALTFNARQGEREKFQPYFDDSLAYAPPDASRSSVRAALPHTTTYYDPMARAVRVENPDGTFSSVVHRPLSQIQYDEEDNTTDSAHFDTPKTLFYDGLERITTIREVNHVDGQLETYSTTYEYDPLGNLTRIVDTEGNRTTSHYDALSRRLYMNNPDKGEMFYQYDDAGNLLQTTDAKGQVIRYSYDAANRPLREEWQLDDGTLMPYVVYHYDNDRSAKHPDAQNTLGQLTYIEDQAGATYFSYDARGNITGNIRHLAEEDLELVTRMAYDAQDRLTEVTYPNGEPVTYEYNEQKLLERIPGFIDNINYTASSQRDSTLYANGVTTSYQYDNRLRMRLLQSRNGSQLALQAVTYAFDNSSNIISISDNRADRTEGFNLSQAYRYDNLYRLSNVSATYGEIDYTYNGIGNMTHKSSTAADARLDLGEMRYGENGAGAHALTYADGDTYSYDANGNRINKGNTTYTWDYRNQLTSVDDGPTSSSYQYDANGQRVRQTVMNNGLMTTTLYIGQYAEVRGEQLIQYIFADDGRIAQMSTPFDAEALIEGFTDEEGKREEGKREEGKRQEGKREALPLHNTQEGKREEGKREALPLQGIPETRWYLSDHLGGTSLMVDEKGQITSEVAYYPYGMTRYERNGGDVRYRFTGKELDDTGLYYFGARYYDAKTSVWLSTDPMLEGYFPTGDEERDQELPGMGGVFNAVNLNLYHYAGWNPVRYVDPDGRQTRTTQQIPRNSYPEFTNGNPNASRAQGIGGIAELWNYGYGYWQTQHNIERYGNALHNLRAMYGEGSIVNGNLTYTRDPVGAISGFMFFPDINGKPDPSSYSSILPQGLQHIVKPIRIVGIYPASILNSESGPSFGLSLDDRTRIEVPKVPASNFKIPFEKIFGKDNQSQ